MNHRSVSAIVVILALLIAGCGGGTSGKGSKGAKSGKDSVEAMDRDALMKRLEKAGASESEIGAAGCHVTTPELQEPIHVADVDKDKYTSDPPVSGNHFSQWAKWGTYSEPVPDVNAIHNMEHGGVVVWMGDDVPGSFSRSISAKLAKKGNKILITTRPGSQGVVAGAWGMLLECSGAFSVEGARGQFNEKVERMVKIVVAWYEATNSVGHEREKDIPAFEGSLTNPRPERDISLPLPE